MQSASDSETNDTKTTLAEAKAWMRDFVEERGWQEFHNAKNLSMSIAIEAGGLMEHFQWLTSQQVSEQTGYDRQQVCDELADVACYVLSLANALDIDLASAIDHKMAKNRIKYPSDTATR